MNARELIVESLQSWMQILPVVEQYDLEEYTTERSLELNGSLEEPIRKATLAAQTLREDEASIDPGFYAEAQRLADALCVALLALRRFPGAIPPPRPNAGDILRLITPSLQSWLKTR